MFSVHSFFHASLPVGAKPRPGSSFGLYDLQMRPVFLSDFFLPGEGWGYLKCSGAGVEFFGRWRALEKVYNYISLNGTVDMCWGGGGGVGFSLEKIDSTINLAPVVSFLNGPFFSCSIYLQYFYFVKI